MFGNLTRGVCVTGRNSTNDTNTDLFSSVKKPSTFIFFRAPRSEVYQAKLNLISRSYVFGYTTTHQLEVKHC